MNNIWVLVLVQATLASSAAIVLVAMLRRFLRRAVGARAAYWLWLSVPASIAAALLPAPSGMTGLLATTALPGMPISLPDAVNHSAAAEGSADVAGVVLMIWLAGAVLFAAGLLSWQRAFRRSLGPLVAAADGTLRSGRIGSPLLIGVWRPRVIVPNDFELRYRNRDRQLMLDHERAHRDRRDTLVNSLAAAWWCAQWFNPLVYWALGRLRFDQELACDALVLSRSKGSRKQYADALLTAQLTESSWRVPVGCHWQSNHPLKERIAMLKFPVPTRSRRLTGVAFAVVLAASCLLTISSIRANTPAKVDAVPVAEKIAIEARDTEIRKVIEMIAQKGRQNILVGDRVSGKITVQLKDMTWREALDVVVQSQGLVARQSGNLTIVDVAQ